MDGHCKGRNRDGQPCRALVTDGSAFCRWHDPKLEEQRQEWRRQGGTARSNQARARKALSEAVMTSPELAGVLSQAIRRTLEGDLEPGVGSAIATLSRALAEVRKTGELEERLGNLEKAAGIVHINDRRAS